MFLIFTLCNISRKCFCKICYWLLSGFRDPSSASMQSAATPSSSNFVHDFTLNSFYVPSFSSTPNSIRKNPNSIESNVVNVHGGPLRSPSFLELPTLKHVSKAFHIEVWFLSHSPGN